MDRLRICIEALRLLAKLPDTQGPVRAAELRINEYLGTDAKWRSLIEPLRSAVNAEAVARPTEGPFWVTVRDYIHSRLPDD